MFLLSALWWRDATTKTSLNLHNAYVSNHLAADAVFILFEQLTSLWNFLLLSSLLKNINKVTLAVVCSVKL